MMELKVQCDCGQKYKFDVEPVNGRMPFTVACPVCGADGTGKANAILQQSVVYQIPPPPPPAPEQPRLRVSDSAGAPASSAPPPIRPLSAVPAPAMRPGTSFAQEATAEAQARTGRKPSFALGLLGGLLGALIGALIYFLIFKYTGLRFKLLAVGVGGLAGWGAELFGRGEGSKELGGITAIMVVSSVIAAQYFVAWGWWHEFSPSQFADSAYTNAVAEAKEVVKAIPTGSDAEIRNYLAKAAVEEGDKPNPGSVTKDEVKQFRDNNLPEFQELAGGRITKEQYDEKNGIDTARIQREEVSSEDTFKGIFLLLLISKTNIVSLIAAAGLAFKMSTNA